MEKLKDNIARCIIFGTLLFSVNFIIWITIQDWRAMAFSVSLLIGVSLLVWAINRLS